MKFNLFFAFYSVILLQHFMLLYTFCKYFTILCYMYLFCIYSFYIKHYFDYVMFYSFKPFHFVHTYVVYMFKKKLTPPPPRKNPKEMWSWCCKKNSNNYNSGYIKCLSITYLNSWIHEVSNLCKLLNKPHRKTKYFDYITLNVSTFLPGTCGRFNYIV